VTQPARRAQAASRDHAANGIAPRLATFLRRLAGCEVPVRLRAFDGSEAGPAGAPTLVLRSPLALRRLMWSPGELGLADAYVTGAIDVEGDLVAVMRLMRELTRGRGGSSARLTAADVLQAARLAIVTGAVGPRRHAGPASAGGCTAGAGIVRPSHITTTSPMTSTSCCSIRPCAIRAGTGAAMSLVTGWSRPSATSSTWSAPSWGSGRACDCSTSDADGAPWSRTPQSATEPGQPA